MNRTLEYLPVKLRATGSQHRGPCPLPLCESDTGFSLTLDTGKGRGGAFRCFSCGQDGDNVSLFVDHLGYSFPDALGITGHDTEMTTEVEKANYQARIARQKTAKEKSIERLVHAERLRETATTEQQVWWYAFSAMMLNQDPFIADLAEIVTKHIEGRLSVQAQGGDHADLREDINDIFHHLLDR